MGQRLVITANYKNQEIAKIYFHWSAYTVSALQEAYDLINEINISDYTTIEDLQLQLIRYCERHGGCIDGGANSDEMKYVKFIFPKEEFKGNGSRNQGLIAISDIGRDEIQGNSEGDLIINFDSQEISNYCYSGWDLAEYKNYRKDEYEEEVDFNSMESLDLDLGCIPFNDLSSAIADLQSLHDYVYYTGNEVIELIA